LPPTLFREQQNAVDKLTPIEPGLMLLEKQPELDKHNQHLSQHCRLLLNVREKETRELGKRH
jgi:hypothetical protein